MAKEKTKKVEPINVVEEENVETQASNIDIDSVIPEIDPKEREELIKSFNEHFGQYAEILEEASNNEWIEDVKKSYDDLINDFNTRVYKIGDESNARFIAEFLYKFNKTNVYWTHNAWAGVIKFDEVMTEKLAQLIEGTETILTFNYGELSFAYNALMSPQGRGLESAKAMEAMETKSDDMPYTWSEILDMFGEHIDWIQFFNKKAFIYKQRLAMAWSGVRLNIKCAEDAEYVQLYRLMQEEK